MRVHGIDHVQLAMPAEREDEARRFYGDVLGLPEQSKPPNLATRGGCWFGTEGVMLHLGVEVGFRPAKKAHPALLVEDLPALVRRLGEAGIEVVEDEPLPGYDRVYVADPFGNRIELLEPAPHLSPTRSLAVYRHMR
jgi:catechol 2,3-dioxygenase-like lactoylglutathione lyase family enzyme